MKTKKAPGLFAAFPLAAAALLLGTCVNFGGVRQAGSPQENPAVSLSRDGDGLDKTAFRKLSPETLAYLAALSRAFSSQDREYLLAQGEADYEAAVKPYYDEGSYLAMLYRSGDYAVDKPGESNRRPVLDPGEIRGIEYLDWEEQGPMLVIRGRLNGRTGTLPCKIVLAWRLREPKILGVYP
jgi:hypothetical protein